MVSTPYTLTSDWSVTNACVALASCDMLLSNAAATDIRWARAGDVAAPTLEPHQAHILRPGRSVTVQLDAGEAIWMAGSPKGRAVVDSFALITPDIVASQATAANRGELSNMTPGADGEEVRADGLSYVWSAGADAIPDLPGLLPLHSVALEHFGAIGDGEADDTAAWEAANDYLEDLGGGIIEGVLNRTYALRETTIASGVIFRGAGPAASVLKVHPDTTMGADWMRNRDVTTTASSRDARDLGFEHCTIDGTNLPFARWLSRASGAPVTDPLEDYRPGSGALGAGITGVSLTATVTSGQVTGITINSGGSGWNAHPTHPYQADTVNLYFEGGGGRGAEAVAAISGGTLTGVTVVDGGYGYSGTPTVFPMGGYADVSLLTTTAVDRRNPDFNLVGSGVSLTKVVAPRVEDVVFKNFHCRALADAGCLRGTYRQLRFEGCGKNDGPYHCIWVQSYGDPQSPPVSYAPSEDVLVEDVTVIDAERSAMAFMPARGGVIRRLYASGCGESTIFINDNVCHDGGQVLIDSCTLKDNTLTDIASQLIEMDARNVTIRNCRFEGSSNKALVTTGAQNLTVENTTFLNNNTGRTVNNDYRVPFGPFSERYNYNIGTQPICGRGINLRNDAVISAGTSSSGGSNNVSFTHNTFIETRSGHPSHIFRQARNQTLDAAGDFRVIQNDLRQIPGTMDLWDSGVANVFQNVMPLHITGNLGHPSEAVVNIKHSLTATGTFEIRPGFRPSAVRVYAHTAAVNDLSTALGEFSWTRDGGRNDFTWSFTTDAAGITKTWFYESDVVRIVNSASTQRCRIEFNAWLEDGFRLNAVLLEENCTLRFVCHP